MTERMRGVLEDRLVYIEAILGFAGAMQTGLDGRPSSEGFELFTADEGRAIGKLWGEIRTQLMFPRLAIYRDSKTKRMFIERIYDRIAKSWGTGSEQPRLNLAPDVST